MFHTLNQNNKCNTRAANNYQLDFPPTRTTHCGILSVRKKAADVWNENQRMSLLDL